MTLHGVDISNHQKGIRLDRLPPLDLFIAKASQGTQYPDPYMAGFLAQARELGISRLGIYWWVETHLALQPQLDVLLRHTNNELERDPGLVVFMDWEPRNPERTDFAAEAFAKLKSAIGRQPHIYMNRSAAHTHRWGPVRDLGGQLWAAQYPNKNPQIGFRSDPWFQQPSGWDGKILGLQYTDTGRLPGFAHNLDLNLFWTWPSGGQNPLTPLPVLRVPEIPPLHENDKSVYFYHHHGGQVLRSNGQPRLACLCMALTFPLIEREMIRRGLIRHQIDVYQGAYNLGVTASAGSHDLGGVIDVAQGLSLAERQVWADFGVMMFPRARKYGWTGGEHGHGVWHGCPHQTKLADGQVTSGINGRDGLKGNALRNFEAPTRVWQDAYRQYAAETITITPPEDPVPETREQLDVRFDHPGHSDFAYPSDPDSPVIGPDVIGPLVYDIGAVITGPEGAEIRGRLAFLDRATGTWVGRSPEVPGVGNVLQLNKLGQTSHPECSVYVDVWSDVAGQVRIEQIAHFHRV